METPPPLAPIENSNESDCSWCIALHLSGLSGIVLGIALAHVIVPLVIWLIKRADSPQIDITGKEVLNFQISFSIYFLIAGALCWLLIGFLILPVLLIIWLVYTILAAVRTSNGETYHYPMTIRFLK
jgi:uncharacterized Tic20 family protein